MVGGLCFIIAWDGTRDIVLPILAQIIGIVVTVLIKIGILFVLRAQFFGAFYRKRTGSANAMGLILVLVAAFYIGRLDTPLLAPRVGYVGPVPLDAYPVCFRNDLLIHESHRHPFLERLGVMYMLKLKYGDDFVTRAGAAWRMIFVLTLFPWMRKYRVKTFAVLDDTLTCTIGSADDDAGYIDDNEDGTEMPSSIRKALRKQKLHSQRKFKSMSVLKTSRLESSCLKRKSRY